MDREKAKAIRESLDKVLADVAKEHGVEIVVGRGTFGPFNATFKLEVAEKDTKGTALTREAQEFQMFAERFGFHKNDLGAKFSVSGRSYTLMGLSIRSSRLPILAKRDDGKVFKFPALAALTAVQNELDYPFRHLVECKKFPGKD